MATKSETAVDRFISDTRDLFSRESDLEKRWTALKPILATFLADRELQQASRSWPNPGVVEGRGGNLLFYEDPDYGFVINGQVHEPGRRQTEPTSAHDHGSNITAYGLLDGHERIVMYERTDDRSRPDYATVRQTADYIAGPGDIHLAMPRDIHVELSVGERTAAVIIRSMRDGVPSNLHGHYDLLNNAYLERVGPRQVPAEMIPAH
jgi:hypothetical protein